MNNKKLNRKTFLKKCLYAVGSSAALLGAGGLYGILGERYWVQTKTVPLAFRRFPSAFSGIRVVQFSDTHLGKYYSLERMKRVIDLIQMQKPDMICFTGDLFDSVHGEVSDEIIPLLSRLEAGLGKFAVLGNHDMRLKAERVKNVLERSGFTVLVNASRSLVRGTGRIRVAGIADMLYDKPDLKLALHGAREDEFVLLLAHEPDSADLALKYPIDWQISGHSHGGQIRVPLLGTMFLPDGGKKYMNGHYTFEGSELQLYTNRGIGTTLLPVRFNCRPEITVFLLKGPT